MQVSFGIGLSIVFLSAALADWSLISLLFLVGFLTVQYNLRGQVQRGRSCSLLWISVAVAICTILLGLTVVIISAILGTGLNYSVLEIIGLSRLNPSRDMGGIVLFFVPKIAVGVVASCGLYCEQRRTSAEFGSPDNEAFEVRAVLRSFILPTVHVVAGSIFPCWVALPYFICSCTGLFHWSMTSNFVGLSWGWKPLLVYNGAHMLLLYVRQLPIPLPDGLLDLADYVGLFKVSIDGMGWLEGVQAISLIALFILLCFAIGEMEDFDCSGLSREKEVLPVIMINDDEDNIHESLLQHTSPRETRERTWWDSEQRRVLAFREAAFCFFAYGFPICLVALVCWSFKFESFCALVLLIYVGVILYVFPSLFLLRRLNGMLLGFILLWALSTYIFNAAFTIMTSNFKVDTAIWQTIGLWRYSSPGLFIMAQFALGVLVATDLFVGNNILANQSQAASVIREDLNFIQGEPQDRWILFMVVVVWCMHRSADVITLLLIFLVGLRSGLIHAVYIAFFMVYLLSSSVASKTQQYLMVYCELHLGVLYILQLDWISRMIANHKVVLKPVLSQLGIWNKATFHDYMAVAVLLCFCAVQLHGIKVISSLSAAALQSAETVRRYTPFLLSVSGSHSPEYHSLRSSEENWITKHLAAVGKSFRAFYRSFGTYIVYATVLAAVYAAKPNYVSFGFLFLLMVWIIGRQILGKTESPFWIPLFVYTCLVFLTRYILSVFPDLQQQVGKYVRLNDDFGFDPKASLFWHLWDSLAILAVMQLYKYERSQLSAVAEPTCSSPFTTNSCKSVDFMKRLLILHSGKILSIAVFYASITPVGGFGLVYLLMLVFTCNMRKSSALPAQLYAVYTGLLVVVEYLFQMFGKETGTYTGQVHGPFVHWLGLRVYDEGVWGIESGSQCKIIVLVACMLQYCSLQWLDQVPAALRRGEEPCLLFHHHGPRGHSSKDPMLGRLQKKVERLDGAIKDERHEASNSLEKNGKTSPVLSRLTSRESKKWNRRAMILKQEKYEAQWQALTIWSKYVHEHFFTIYGVEVNMITLLVGGFAVLNIFSLVYVFILALCIMLSNRCIRKLWPLFVFLFACILVSEYAVLADFPPSWNVPPTNNEIHMHCHDCWKDSNSQLGFCWKCWLGAVDDRQMLVAYFMVFIISSFQLRANNTSENSSFHSAGLVATEKLAWSEISYETTEQWTWLDHLRFLFYRHLLHLVLLLVFVTGTLQYDLLHLGYLAFSMVFFRMRTTIMKKGNTIFCFLRLYNFSLIVASLIFQAPFFGFLDGRGCTPFSIFGLSKYDYGFRITARSALVDITIFCLVGLQSRIFRTTEFGQVLRYLAAEQVEARAHAQENKAAWKKEQLQRIREIEERKIHRRLQVDKMKMDMVPLQLRLDVLNSAGKVREAFSPIELPETFRRYGDDSVVPNTPTRLVSSFSDSALFDHAEGGHVNFVSENTCRRRGKLNMSKDGVRTERLQTSSSEAMTRRAALGNGSLDEIRQDSHEQVPSPPQVASKHSAKHGLLSGVTLFGDGVAQMHNLGNQALANLVGLLNLDHADSDDTSSSSAEDDGKPENEASQTQSQEYISYRDTEVLKPAALSETRHRLSMICHYLWSKVIANTDIVCYVLFVLVYVWNFSLLTLVYPASLFLYALLVNPGPTQFFWSAMLIYTEMSILLQYMYQIIVNHCGHDDLPSWLKKLGISGRNMNRSFVASVLPLFLVYLSTLVQSSIKARDGEWMFVTEGNTFSCRQVYDAENQSILTSSSLRGKVWKLWTVISGACIGALKTVLRCWRSLTTGSEVPPHFVQVTLSVPRWPGDGIQPERIQSAFNKLLAAVRQGDPTCNYNAKDASRVRVESLESGKDMDTALAVLEVIHAAPPIGTSVSSLLTSLTPASDVASEIMKAKHDARLEAVGFPYPIISIIAGGKKQIDLYAYIFGTDLIAFLYVALFYQSFIKNSPEFLDVYQLEDQFPKEFVFVLMTLFFLIVLDRVLYLTASAIGKVFYYFFTLVLYTSYVTSFVWGMEVKPSDRIFFQLLPLRGFYLLKALSLSLQALQLRYGLPHKSTLYEQFLMRRVNSLTWLGFRIYRALPFLFELRCVLDWSCTTTSFSMYDWLKLEDIYASLFLVQCDIKLAREKHHLGEKRSVWIKFCNGICLFFILICVIWAPMLIYSSGNPTNFVNEITEAHAQIGIRTSGGSFTLYETQMCKLHSMSDIIAAGFDIDPNSSLASFDAKDVQLICCEKDANSLWLIPPPTLRNLVNTFDDGVVIISSWNFRRERPKGKEIVTFTGQPLEIGSLQGVLNGTYDSVGVENLYPRYFRLTSAGEVRVLEQTDAMVSGDLTLNREIQIWWSFSRSNASAEDGCGGVTGPLAIAVSEEVPKGLIGDTLSKFNIWSLYITFVLAVGRFIRLQCADLRMRIPYENFPSCDRLKAICEDIYAARAEGELELEEGLFWTLVKIYRSPHILMEYTKAE